MILGIDYLAASTHAPGLGRYGRELVRALAPMADRPELALFSWGRERRSIPPAWLGLNDPSGRPYPGIRRFDRRLPERLCQLAFRAGFGADRWLGGCDLFLRMHPDRPPVDRAACWLPLAEFPPEGSPAEARLGEQARGHAGILVFSRAGHEQALRRLGLPESKVHQLPVGADHWLRDFPPLPHPADPPTVVVLGAVRQERLPEEALQGFERLHARRPECRLLWFGPPGRGSERFRSLLSFSSARSAIDWQERPEEQTLARALQSASVLLHLSLGEASAVTPLEGAACGAGLVVSRLPAFEEALGDLPSYVETPLGKRAGEPIGRALEAALERGRDPAFRARAQVLGGQSTWAANARSTLALWRSQGLL